MLGYGSFAANGHMGSRGLQAKAVASGLVAFGALTVVSMCVLGRGAGPAELFMMSSPELSIANDPLQASLAGVGTGNTRDYAKAIKKAMLSASYDNSMMDQARRHEKEANAVVAKDEAQLSSLSLYDTADPTVLHTGTLPDLEGLTGPYGRYSSTADTDASNVAGGMLDTVTATQLSGLQDELNTLTARQQSIVDGLTLQRQSTAVKAAHDALFADTLRLHRAAATASNRALRDALNAARIAARRSKEASIIEQNEAAIARIAQERAARLEAYREKAMQGAVQAESDIRKHKIAIQREKTSRYHKAMGRLTQQLQNWVAQDMSTLGKLKVAEENAAIGPRLHGSVWRQPPFGADLPDIDPAYITISDAPYRNASSLVDYKAVEGTTQLSQQKGVSDEDDGGSSIVNIMKLADEEYSLHKQPRLSASPDHQARLKAVHTKVDSELQQLNDVAAKVGVDDVASSWDGNSQDSRMAVEEVAPATKGGFTSFPSTASLQSVEASDGDVALLDDGALIRHAKQPQARLRIPLGAHQDAKKGHGAVRAPRPTIMDASTEAQAVRADGSHNTLSDEDLDRGSVHSPRPLHMPHVA